MLILLEQKFVLPAIVYGSGVTIVSVMGHHFGQIMWLDTFNGIFLLNWILPHKPCNHIFFSKTAYLIYGSKYKLEIASYISHLATCFRAYAQKKLIPIVLSFVFSNYFFQKILIFQNVEKCFALNIDITSDLQNLSVSLYL